MGQVVHLYPVRQSLPDPLNVAEVLKVNRLVPVASPDLEFLLDAAMGLRRVDNPHYRTILTKYLGSIQMFKDITV